MQADAPVVPIVAPVKIAVHVSIAVVGTVAGYALPARVAGEVRKASRGLKAVPLVRNARLSLRRVINAAGLPGAMGIAGSMAGDR